MCETGELTPMDVMGIALVADNELVKHERKLEETNARNVFDCELDKMDKLHSYVKSMLTTVGFTYTEVIPFDLIPLPDHDSPSMTLPRRYGDRVPILPKIDPNDEKLSVRVTRWITKKHVHVFPMVKVNTKLPNQPMLSLAGINYEEECSEATLKVIQKYIEDLEVSETTDSSTETDIPIVLDALTQCSAADFDNPTLGPIYPQLHNYESLCKDMLMNMLKFYSSWNSLQYNGTNSITAFQEIQNNVNNIFFPISSTTSSTVSESMSEKAFSNPSLSINSTTLFDGVSQDIDSSSNTMSVTLTTIPTITASNASVMSLSLTPKNNATSDTTNLLQNLSGQFPVMGSVSQPNPHSKSAVSDTVTQDIDPPMQEKRKLIDNTLINLKDLYPRELDNLVDSLNLLNEFANTLWNMIGTSYHHISNYF